MCLSGQEKVSWKFFAVLLTGLSGCGVFLFLSNATRDAWVVQGTIVGAKVNEWEWDLLEDDRTFVTFDTGETLVVPMTLHDIIVGRSYAFHFRRTWLGQELFDGMVEIPS
jgi:hypothetical protein